MLFLIASIALILLHTNPQTAPLTNDWQDHYQHYDANINAHLRVVSALEMQKYGSEIEHWQHGPIVRAW